MPVQKNNLQENKPIPLLSLLDSPGSPTVRVSKESDPVLPGTVVIDGGSPQVVVIDEGKDSDRPPQP